MCNFIKNSSVSVNQGSNHKEKSVDMLNERTLLSATANVKEVISVKHLHERTNLLVYVERTFC